MILTSFQPGICSNFYVSACVPTIFQLLSKESKGCEVDHVFVEQPVAVRQPHTFSNKRLD